MIWSRLVRLSTCCEMLSMRLCKSWVALAPTTSELGGRCTRIRVLDRYTDGRSQLTLHTTAQPTKNGSTNSQQRRCATAQYFAQSSFSCGWSSNNSSGMFYLPNGRVKLYEMEIEPRLWFTLPVGENVPPF